jgi:hypothetical protein
MIKLIRFDWVRKIRRVSLRVHVLCWLIRLQNLEFISNIKDIKPIEKFLSFMF